MSILRYSTKLNIQWFPWKPQFIKINEIYLFTLVYQQMLLFQWLQLVRFVLAYGLFSLITRCHGNEKLKFHIC